MYQVAQTKRAALQGKRGSEKTVSTPISQFEIVPTEKQKRMEEDKQLQL